MKFLVRYPTNHNDREKEFDTKEEAVTWIDDAGFNGVAMLYEITKITY